MLENWIVCVMKNETILIYWEDSNGVTNDIFIKTFQLCSNMIEHWIWIKYFFDIMVKIFLALQIRKVFNDEEDLVWNAIIRGCCVDHSCSMSWQVNVAPTTLWAQHYQHYQWWSVKTEWSESDVSDVVNIH